MTPQEALARIVEHREIFHEEMLSLMRQIMSGEVSATLIAAIVAGLRVKKETIGEISAAAQVMREFATHVPVADTPNLIDTCGTGGDAAQALAGALPGFPGQIPVGHLAIERELVRELRIDLDIGFVAAGGHVVVVNGE